MPKPAVMAVNGIAFTLSIELALATVIVIAADDVRSRQLETGRGIIPSGGATFRAPAQPGWGNAMRFLLTAGEYDAAEVSRTGLAQEVVPAGAHVQRAADLAHLIAQRAPLGVLATLASASAGLGRGPDAARGCVASLLPGIMRSQDAADGLRSFTEQPEARFTGHRPVPAGRLLRALRPHPLGRRRLLVVPRTRRSVLDVEPTPERSALQIIGAIIHGLGASDSLLFVAIAWRQLEVKVTASGCPESGLARRQCSIEWGYLPPAGGASYEPFARSRQAPDQPHLPIEGVAEVPWPRQVNVA